MSALKVGLRGISDKQNRPFDKQALLGE